jgi:hypothetical protein
MGSPLFLADLLTGHEPAVGAPGTAPASRQTDVSNKPRRCSALRFMESPLFLADLLTVSMNQGRFMGSTRGPQILALLPVKQGIGTEVGGASSPDSELPFARRIAC